MQAAEAAEKRKREMESRGVKNPEKLKQQQRKQEEIERKTAAAEMESGKPTLKVLSLCAADKQFK